jgi:hypothetical protein
MASRHLTRTFGLAFAATLLGPAAQANSPVQDTATSDLGCAVRLMVFVVKSEQVLAAETDAAEQTQVRKNIALGNRGFAYFVGKLDGNPADPKLRARSQQVFEGLRGLSGDVMIDQVKACTKIWQSAENSLIKTFREKP